MKPSRNLIVATVACVLAAGGAFAAASPAATATTAVTVRYGDLNLSNPEGAAALYARLRSAARKVCGTADPRELSAYDAVKQCYELALADAVERIDQARLVTLHRARTNA